ncbi:unnamed protein product [Pedinophyceae sp. YPF-701]|nr:unnamed protein product [Pedinophyceae sp. YPF-701]
MPCSVHGTRTGRCWGGNARAMRRPAGHAHGLRGASRLVSNGARTIAHGIDGACGRPLLGARLAQARCQRTSRPVRHHTRLVCRAAKADVGADSPETAAPTKRGEVMLVAESLGKTHDGEKQLFRDLTFSIHKSDRVCVIGANGSGKSSLLSILAGSDAPTDGSLQVKRGVSTGRCLQDPEYDPDWTALEAVLSSAGGAAEALREYERAAASGDADALADATAAVEAADGWTLSSEAEASLSALGIADATVKIGAMSGGQRRRVALAGALLGAPDLIVLDEPTNHLDFGAIDWLAARLVSQGAATTVVLVTHDRSFMERVCTRVLEIDQGSAYMHEVGGSGSYGKVRELRAERRAAQQAAADAARTVLRKETEWMRRQPKARSTKSRARINQFYELTAKARDRPQDDVVPDLAAAGATAQRQGNVVLEVDNVAWGHDPAKPLFRSFFYEFGRGERIGVVGRNGAGKSSLLDVLAGVNAPTEGAVTPGETTAVGYFTQHPPAMPEGSRVIDYLKQDAAGGDAGSWEDGLRPEVVLERLGFPRPRQQQLIGLLSGGERRRLQLAAVLAGRPNFLLLDEPTNDLDLDTVEALEGVLASYGGTLVVVSHDRAFLEGCADRLFVLEGDGEVRLFDGPYGEYVEAVREREAAAARRSASSSATADARQPRDKGAAQPQGGNKVKKLAPWEVRELEELEGEVEALEERVGAAEAGMAKASAAGDYGKLQEWTDELGVLQGELEAKTERWLELAERAEAA